MLTARERVMVLDAVEEQLGIEPTVETRNRKPMRSNPLAAWELRVEHLRVYSDVEGGIDPTVVVLAVGVKEREQVRIGGEVIEL